MIINFSVENFGCIKEKQILSFEADKSKHLEDYYIVKVGKYRLLKIALIYGANASGKTTILKAIDFLRNLVLHPAQTKNERLKFQPFLFVNQPYKRPTILSIEFLHNGVKYFYEVEFTRKAVLQEFLYFYNPKKALVFKRITDVDSQFVEIFFGSKIKIEKTLLKSLQANTLWNNTVLGGYLKTNIEIKELKEVIDWFRSYLNSFIDAKTRLSAFITDLVDRQKIRKSDILAILRKADLNISNIIIEKKQENLPNNFFKILELINDIPPDKKQRLLKKNKVTIVDLKFEHYVKGKKYPLPFALESDGTKRYYSFAGLLALLIRNSKAFLIDELEASLHPDLYEHFLLMFLVNTKRSQIIATTHNREILNDRDLIRDDAIWITDKNEEAATELYSFADFGSKVIRDTTNRLNVYKSGKLGGVPNLGDYFFNF